MLRILLIEDDVDLANGIIDFLELKGVECDYAHDGQIGLNLAIENSYDLIVLDINLPIKSGFTVCSELRAKGQDTPILMLTAKDTLEDKLTGFDSGTDDYLIKPFDIQELLARIKALSKRKSTQSKMLSLGDLQMNLSLKTVTRAGQSIALGNIGWIILETLLKQSPDAVSKEQLEQIVWYGEPPSESSLKVHIFRLREKVDKPFAKALIQTIAGYGFAMRVEDER